ncbi:MAG: thioredoxin domain-containing protein [Ectothiorhodospiraceae bacterium]|nr:thioredoxin domain-containing protein [Ectothiorhodospiraceae bacterium]
MSNRLVNQTSPYLLQHAHNPVDWFPWGEEAIAKARAENKPILLSIGYSACHWCHVMEHESFEDEATAELMNRLFVNIKVDREERPDLDKIYQFSYQLLNQRGGGWPLNMFLTPDDHTAFFGGTYFPPEARYNMPAFSEILQRVASFYAEHPEDIQKQNASVHEYLTRSEKGSSVDIEMDAMVIDEARRQLEKNYDTKFAGFGAAPKFPHPTNLERLLRHWSSTGRKDQQALNMARTTLHAMASGGMFDQLGGGFCRYSVDAQWMIPHFEKMLYDNGPLLVLYADAYAATGDKAFKRVVEETAGWVMREMQSGDGGYCSSLDADSEGVEGKFYAWQLAEVQQQLNDTEYDIFTRHYGLDRPANFEGAWNLHVFRGLEDIAVELKLDESVVARHLSSARKTLLAARELRVRPRRDEKILTSWNGLMIKGMAVAGRRLGREDLIDSAQQALIFVRENLWVDGRLLATSKGGKAHLMAYLDDYVFMADGVLAMLETRWNDDDLNFLIALMDTVLEHFSAKDENNSTGGGFYFTADDHEQLIQRPRPWMDEALPSGNGIAAQVLLRLGHLLGETRYLDAAEATLKAAWQDVRGFPQAHNALLTAAEEYWYPTETVIMRGPQNLLDEWVSALAVEYAPRRLVLSIPNSAVVLPGALAGYAAPSSGVTAYVCREARCLAPISALATLKECLST